MAFGYFDKKKKKGIVATNLKSIEQFSGISYNTLSNWLRNKKIAAEKTKFYFLKNPQFEREIMWIKHYTHCFPI